MVENTDFLFEFIDDLPVGIACADTTGELPNQYNKFFTNMFGWDASDIETLDIWFIKAYPDEEYRAELMTIWMSIIEEAEQKNSPYSKPMEARVTCKDGSSKWCEGRYYRKAQFVYGIFVDISERKAVEKRLLELSLLDPLTGINNRRHFNVKFYEWWQLSVRTKSPISLILCDIDNFKTLNDTYGHLVGDEALIMVAETIAGTLKRGTDFVARYGGEEFIVVSYDSDAASVLALCKKIKQNLDNINGSGINDKIHCCSLSFGVNTIVANPDTTPEDFINNADKALYEAKRRGKNTIVVYDEKLGQ